MSLPALTVLMVILAQAPGSTQGRAAQRPMAPCAAYSSSDAVFVGRVDSVSRTASRRVVTFTILESFRGTSSSTVSVLAPPAADRCAVSFRPGHEYMVYAAARDSQLVVAPCSRTRGLDDAAADVEYARAAKGGIAGVGTISGQVVLGRRDLTGREGRGAKPLENVTVTVTSNGASTSAISNLAGDYATPAPGRGRATIRIDLPARYYTDDGERAVALRDAQACAEVDFAVYDNHRISGRVIDASGRHLPGLTVELAASGLTQRARVSTDPDGRFAFTRVPSGRYVVRAGTSASALATRSVAVGIDEAVVLEDLRLPPEARYVVLSGFVVNADGVPAEGARVFLKGAAENARIVSEPVRADFLGRFAIAAVAGSEYRIFAERAVSRRVDASDQVAVRAVDGVGYLRLVLQRRF